MKIREDMAGKIYDLVLPGLTADGSINLDLQRKVIDFVLQVQGVKEPGAAEKIYDFTQVKKIRAELEARKTRS